jgi:uncharacterized membrane protein YphA (DoxX/SURF4 family)
LLGKNRKRIRELRKEKIIPSGRHFLSITITAFGVQSLTCERFRLAVVPVIPWLPGNPILAYLAGLLLVVAGLSIAAHVKPRQSAILLGVLFLFSFLLLPDSRVAARPPAPVFHTHALLTLSIGGAALTLAGTRSGAT